MLPIFQVIKKSLGGNPYGCWNWFGYLSDLMGEKYAQKDAVQMLGVYKMIERAANL